MTPIIEVKDVHKTFRTYEQVGTGLLSSFRKKKITKRALVGASLSINKGDMIAILGKNGSGKSTLIKLLVGIMPPDTGAIKMLGMDPWKDRIKLARKYGVVLGAHPVLFTDLPAIDSFEYMRKVYGIEQKVFRERLDYLINLLELRDVYKRPVRELSLGESMKCNFVAAVLHFPEIVILDEPTIGVDLPSMLNLRQTILDLNKRYGTTFIISTHILEDVKVLAERVAIINEGKMVFNGTKDELSMLYGDKKIVEIFFTNRPKNIDKVGRAVSIDGGYAELEIEASMIKSRSLSDLLADKGIVDYNISDPDISHVLERFYKGMPKKEVKE